MASQMVDLLQGTAASLRADARLAGVNVSVHGGNFTDEELKAYGAAAPHVVIALLGADMHKFADNPVALVSMVAVVIDTDRPGPLSDRHTRALSLTDAVFRVLSKLWVGSVDGISRAKDLSGRNLYSRAWDGQGLGTWALSWTQIVELRDAPVAWDTFKILDTKYDITPRDNGAPLGQVIEAEDSTELDP